jgi:hypothetical protein
MNSRQLPIPKEQIGTLHAMAYHALGMPKIAETAQYLKQFSEEHPAYEIDDPTRDGIEDGYSQGGKTPGAKFLQEYSRLRSLMRPPDAWPESVQGFARVWEKFKDEVHAVDFTDLISVCLKEQIMPKFEAAIGMFDEAQDFTPLELALVRLWGKDLEKLILVGDGDQCQPSGTLVETTQGQALIEDLDPEIHTLQTFDRPGSTIIRLKRPPSASHSFEKACRIYDGILVMIAAGPAKSEYTADHQCLVRWTEEARTKCVVYLMKQGPRWRIGWCQLFKGRGKQLGFHLSVRARLENADAVWILKTTSNRQDASWWESFYAAHFGIPQITFNPIQSSIHFTKDFLDSLWAMHDINSDLTNRAYECLAYCNKSMQYPFYKKNNRNHWGGKASLMLVRAINLEPYIMSVPVDTGVLAPTWYPIQKSTRHYFGEVHSLNVRPHHYYIADKIITHNCIYSFKGAVPRLGLDPSIPIIILKQSYRVSQAVHEFSEQVINLIPPEERLQREYLPTAEPGEVLELNGTYKHPEAWFDVVQKHLDQYQTVMILASCSYMLTPIIQFLKQEAIPYSNTYRRKRRDWNPLIHTTRQTTAATRVRDYFAGWRRNPMNWTGGELGRWLPLVANVLKRGGKEKLANILSDQEAPVDLIHEVLPMEQMQAAGAEWILDHLSAAHRPAEYHVRVGLRAWEDLEIEPALTIGTVHCSPSDELILTTDGWIPIGKLDPSFHKVAGYNKKTNSLHWGGDWRGKERDCSNKRYNFKISKNKHVGPLVVLDTDISMTRVTPNHLIPTRFNDDFMEKYVVYLMKRANWWRIGICVSAHRPYRSGGVNGRLATEQADFGWILGVYETRKEAVIAEEIFRGKYGITGLTFQAAKARALNDDDLHHIHDEINGSIDKRVTKLLEDCHLNEEWPLYSRAPLRGDVIKRNMRGIFVTEAANLIKLSGYIDMLVPPEGFVRSDPGGNSKRGCWTPAFMRSEVTIEDYNGYVFGIEVPPHHYYLSGGNIVHNSVKGGEADAVILFADLSPEAAKAVRQGEIGPTARMFFVGATRARTSLYLGKAANSGFALKWPG